MELETRLEEEAARATRRKLKGAFDGLARETLLRGLKTVEADEGTLWVVGPKGAHLVPVFNSGPNAERFLAEFRQPIDRGLISLVLHSGQVFCENEVAGKGAHDASIDTALNVVTSAMIAVPLVFGHQLRGVVSCVRLNRSGTFDGADLEEIQHTALLLERLLDWNLLQSMFDA